ncbi:MAG: NADH-quinone oxidoreductase subunit L [Trueperaceae bacterium]|nr:NADH-quinone oxidoreductase subunit L [Trueperaceae bacterium]
MSDPAAWIALVPAIALIGALINGLFGRSFREPFPGVLATAVAASGFVLSLVAFVALQGREQARVGLELWPYLQAGTFELSLGVMVDPLSVLMMLVITGVGTLIHLYSVGYMHADAGYSRYFSFLNLFIAAMSVLVLADSFVLMFVGWEGVGVASFLLIGFWYQTKANADAARKAFIVNRIGDVGFLLAMFLMVATFGTLNIAEVNAAAVGLAFGSGTAALIGLFLLVAAAGKSAQLPLQVWLPDAMAGPTPVSALIHAATMVTAGVYLIARTAPLFSMTPLASAAVAWVGALTALVAALAALGQTDIKKILAYSTISQLGYMFVAVGVGAYWVAIFHVFTHAFFKALLFLGSGSVIHALGGEQDIRRMGGLGAKMKITGTTSLIATLAIAGVPLLSGFFSKDAILAHAFTSLHLDGYGTYGLYGVLLVTAALTAFYMFRWYYGIFGGKSRMDAKAAARVHESPATMTVPLMVLAFFAVFAGYLGLPEFAFPNWIAHWLEPATLGGLTEVPFRHPAAWVEWTLILASIVAAGVGLALGWWIYAARGGAPVRGLAEGRLARLSRSGLGFDAAYRALFIGGAEGTASGVAVLDRDLVDRGLLGLGSALGLFGRLAARLQSGFVRSYAFTMFVGVGVLVILVAWMGVRA